MLSADFLRISQFGLADGDQSLIMSEIVACLKAHKCSNLWLPFSIGGLASYARSCGITVRDKLRDVELIKQYKVDSLYLGTPTIVANKKLFPDSAPGEWTKLRERKVMRGCCASAAEIGAQVIITGLGSGDITVKNRIADMTLPGWSEPRVICMKDFGEFTDWLLFTERKSDGQV
jgi:hypothetical protein